MTEPLCPVCQTQRPAPAYRPFCSKRCADVDLGRWLNGRYAIPGEAAEEAEDAPPSAPPAES